MKKAIIVVGSHYVGKSKTIRQYLKPKLGIGRNKHKFSLNGIAGYILSQSFEEADRNLDKTIQRYNIYGLLVLAARPSNEKKSFLKELKLKLHKAGFVVSEVLIERTDEESYYEHKASEILMELNN